MVILDTNVISEILRPSPEQGVLDWLRSQPRSQLFTTTITQAEILFGVASMPKSARREKLARGIEAIFDHDFENKVLSFDSRAAECYAEIASHRRSAGRPISQLDAMIAGIARAHRARLITRNGRDFVDCDVEVVDPWSA